MTYDDQLSDDSNYDKLSNASHLLRIGLHYHGALADLDGEGKE